MEGSIKEDWKEIERRIKKEIEKAPGAIRIGSFFMHQAAKVLPGGGTIEIPFVCISLTAFIRALYQRNR